MKNTKGPWEINKDRTALTANGIKIFDVNTGVEPISEDAHLIAAAPEMLEALLKAEQLLKYATSKGAFTSAGGDYYIDRGLVDKALCKALSLDHSTIKTADFEDALKKARGES